MAVINQVKSFIGQLGITAVSKRLVFSYVVDW